MDERVVSAWAGELLGSQRDKSALPKLEEGEAEDQLRSMLSLVETDPGSGTPAAREGAARLLRARLDAVTLKLAHKDRLNDELVLEYLGMIDRCLGNDPIDAGDSSPGFLCAPGGLIDLLLQDLPLATWVYDARGNLISMNASAEDAIGNSFDELRKLNLFRDVPVLKALRSADGVPLTMDEYPAVRALRGDKVTHEEFQIQGSNSEGSYLIDAAPLRDAQGRVQASITVMRETTHEQAGARPSGLEGEPRTGEHELPVLLWKCDSQGQMIFANAAWAALTGTPPTEALGERWLAFVEPRHRRRCRRALAIALRRRRPFQFSYRLKAGNGTYRRLTSSGVPLYDDTGRFLGLLGADADRDERTELRTALEAEHERTKQISLHKSRILAALSHDLRSPINAVKLSSEILSLKAQASGDGILQDCHDTISSALRNVTDLLDDLANLSRLESPTIVSNATDFELVPALEEVFAPIEFEARARGLATSLDCASVFGLYLHTDRPKLKQIVSNLLSNAVRYTQNGSIRLKVGLDTTWLRIQVIDTGVGIAEPDQQRIFEEFIRLNENRKGVDSGMGLGLAIAQQLTRLLGGKLEVTSELGMGSRFSLLLPASLLHPPEPTNRPAVL